MLHIYVFDKFIYLFNFFKDKVAYLSLISVSIYLISSKDKFFKPTDCQDVYNKGFTSSGIYMVSPDGTRVLTVYCEQEIDGGGWTVGSYFDLQSIHLLPQLFMDRYPDSVFIRSKL